ncbi:MFS transporter [Sesbania bispinosa]|nr:MFS transporter [Sesbania bispinosa]
MQREHWKAGGSPADCCASQASGRPLLPLLWSKSRVTSSTSIKDSRFSEKKTNLTVMEEEIPPIPISHSLIPSP